MITPSALLDAWERGAALPISERAPSILALLDPGCDPDLLTVGSCDALVFQLHRRLFGDELDAVSRCRECGEQVSLPLSLRDLQPEPVPASSNVTLELAGFRLQASPLRNDGLRELAALGAEVSLRDILRRCHPRLIDATGAQVPIEQLPAAALELALEAVAEADPGAHVVLAISCSCGACWLEQLDIRTVFWAELTRWANDLLLDVHQLATGYGWSEPDILALSPWRRAWYQQALAW